MAVYRIEESTLREMANSIRNITGKTDNIVVSNMSTEIITKTENLDGEITAQNTLISEQDAKIAELAEILSSKASGGSDGGIETCTVDLASPFDWELEHLLYSNGNELVDFYPNNAYDRISLTVAKNTMLFINLIEKLTDDPIIVGDAEMIYGGTF